MAPVYPIDLHKEPLLYNELKQKLLRLHDLGPLGVQNLGITGTNLIKIKRGCHSRSCSVGLESSESNSKDRTKLKQNLEDIPGSCSVAWIY